MNGDSNIFSPIKDRMKANPYFSFENMCMEFARRKYIERSPKIAKIFEVYNITGSFGAIAKMAGMESIAKTKSVVSMTTSTRNNFVAKRFLRQETKNLSP
jgi:hypothetical protein